MNTLALFDQAGEPTREAIGVALKRAGQRRALESAGNPWVEKTLALLKDWCAVRKASLQPRFWFEEFRAFCERQHWSAPATHHVWGSLPALAARRGVIRFTGEYTPAESPRTRSHPVKLWMAL